MKAKKPWLSPLVNEENVKTVTRAGGTEPVLDGVILGQNVQS